jgi:hypothetical protein
MEDSQRDPHICSQSEHLTRVSVPIRVVRWDFKKLARIFNVNSFPQTNKADWDASIWTDEARTLCQTIYAQDYEVWESSCEFYDPTADVCTDPHYRSYQHWE